MTLRTAVLVASAMLAGCTTAHVPPEPATICFHAEAAVDPERIVMQTTPAGDCIQLWLASPYRDAAESFRASYRARGLTIRGDSYVQHASLVSGPCTGELYDPLRLEPGMTAGDGTVDVTLDDPIVEIHAHFTGTFATSETAPELTDTMDVDLIYSELDLVQCRH